MCDAHVRSLFREYERTEIKILNCQKSLLFNNFCINENIIELHVRLNGHRHFNSHGHSINDLNICIIKGNLHEVDRRKCEEVKMILLFDTKNN